MKYLLTIWDMMAVFGWADFALEAWHGMSTADLLVRCGITAACISCCLRGLIEAIERWKADV